MVGINAGANLLPINGVSTAQVSDTYPNLFAPAGVTFAIWGIIYLLLGFYSLYQLFTDQKTSKVLLPINTFFIITSIVNSIWIFAWHHYIIWLTVILILIMLFSLIRIADLINTLPLSRKERRITKSSFGIYFGWITIATIANITTLLVSIQWNRLGISDSTWTIVVLFTGVIIASLRTVKDSNIAYWVVPVWAYLGILIKHTSISGFNYKYPQIIIGLIICIGVQIFTNLLLVKKKKIL